MLAIATTENLFFMSAPSLAHGVPGK